MWWSLGVWVPVSEGTAILQWCDDGLCGSWVARAESIKLGTRTRLGSNSDGRAQGAAGMWLPSSQCSQDACGWCSIPVPRTRACTSSNSKCSVILDIGCARTRIPIMIYIMVSDILGMDHWDDLSSDTL